jgi:hypothetical protein
MLSLSCHLPVVKGYQRSYSTFGCGVKIRLRVMVYPNRRAFRIIRQ